MARVYDYYLGGSHNYAVDRDAARQLLAAVPEAPLFAQTNRAFLRRVVRHLVNHGIRQFLDLGSGIPTVGNVHEIAQAAAPDSRVVYVDIDPVAVTQSLSLLRDNPRATAIVGDVCEPIRVITHPQVRDLLDFRRPVGVLMVAVLHFVPESADPAGIVAELRAHLAPGSYLALSVLSAEDQTPEQTEEGAAVYRRIDNPLTVRTTADVVRLLDGFEIVPPGAVPVPQWRPDPADPAGGAASPTVFIGGVGRIGGAPPREAP
jgi:hypothetical protein